MKKVLMLCFVFLQCAGSESDITKSYLDRFLDSFHYDKSYTQALQEHDQAFKELKENIAYIYTKRWVEQNLNQTIIHYEYMCPNDRVKAVLEKYSAAHIILNGKMAGQAAGDGYIIGLLIALYAQLTKSTQHPAQALIMLPIAHIAMQNYRMPKTPYYDIELKLRYNKYEQLSPETLLRALGAVGVAWLSYFCGRFILNPEEQWLKEH